ncbi:MAG: hypothetical protein CL720_05380 [Chloroflexi bacterium]|nr:hypothetical protein [Chloroflexota bacterium]
MSKPNILYIQSDQHNPYIMGSTGNNIIDTSSLDELAKTGTNFTNAYCASPICVPSRTSAITGLYPYESEVWTNDQILNSAIPTYAHSLGANGYDPVQIGRMHFNGLDQYHGFTKRLIGDHGRNHLGSPRPAGTHGDLHFTAGPNRKSLQFSGIGQNAYQIHDQVVTDSAIDFLKNIKEPFALSIGMMLPHQPFIVDEKMYKKYEGKLDNPIHESKEISDYHPYIQWWKRRTGIEEVTDEEIHRCRTAYYGLVDQMDKMIGNIIQCLHDQKIFENTIVVYTSDHGEQLGENGLWWKQTFYENSVKVPAIISWPDSLPSGQKNDSVINQYDLISTILDATNSKQLPRSNGKSLIEHIKDPNSKWKNIAFSEYCMDDSNFNSFSGNLGGEDIHAKPGGVQNRMIRLDNWKLIYYHGYESELFNLEKDPFEQNDLSKDKKYFSVKEKLENLILKDWNPDHISKKMKILKQEQKIQYEWAHNTDPEDTLRWNLDPDKDSTRLDTKN